MPHPMYHWNPHQAAAAMMPHQQAPPGMMGPPPHAYMPHMQQWGIFRQPPPPEAWAQQHQQQQVAAADTSANSTPNGRGKNSKRSPANRKGQHKSSSHENGNGTNNSMQQPGPHNMPPWAQPMMMPGPHPMGGPMMMTMMPPTGPGDQRMMGKPPGGMPTGYPQHMMPTDGVGWATGHPVGGMAPQGQPRYPAANGNGGMICKPTSGNEDMDMYNNVKSSGNVSSKEKGRGNYRCGRCGVPKKGHICPYQPKLKRRPDEPPPEMRTAAVQVEMDEYMVMRRLNLEIQGFPETYMAEPNGGDMVGAEQFFRPSVLAVPMAANKSMNGLGSADKTPAKMTDSATQP